MLWLCCRPSTPGASESALRLCAWVLLAYTPRVVALDEAMMAEVQGSLRLFSGLKALLARLEPQLRSVGCEVAATGLSALGTLALARAGASFDCLANPARTETPPQKWEVTHPTKATHSPWAIHLNCLPLLAFSAARPHAALLSHSGLRTCGQLRELPRGPLTRRVGTGLLHALDMAYLQRPEAFDWLNLPDTFEQRLELPQRVTDTAALLAGAQHLLLGLQLWLQARHLGVTAIELRWAHAFAARSAGPGDHLVVRTAQPLRHMQHLEILLREQLQRCTLAGPVGELTLLALEAHPLAQEVASFLPDEPHQGSQVQQLLERLSARLGANAVRRVVLQDDWRLSHSQSWQAAVQQPDPEPTNSPAKPDHMPPTEPSLASHSATNAPPNFVINSILASEFKGFNAIKNTAKKPQKTQAATQLTAPFAPSFLLSKALPLLVREHRPHYQGPLQVLAGPQRIEGAWWQAAPEASPNQAQPHAPSSPHSPSSPHARDYFVAHSQGAGFVLLCKERLPQPEHLQDHFQWLLVGLYA